MQRHGSSKDISNIDLIKYYKSDVNLILLNKILHFNILRSIFQGHVLYVIDFNHDPTWLSSSWILIIFLHHKMHS